MTCLICRNAHAADASCPTLVRVNAGTVVMGAPAELPEADSLIGTQIGSYRVTRLLGRGGMGSVYLGEHAVIGSKVAIKILHPHLATDPGLVERFHAEARAVNLIGHEHIVNIFDMNVVPPGRHYLVMEYLEGRTLASLAKEPVPIAVALPILEQIAEALQAAHAAGVVHRDLKPENVFLVRRGPVEHFVKLVDFGIAKLFATEVGTNTQTRAGMIVGTPEYMSPEQCTGGTIDGRTDQYALGCIAYALATGRLPFSSASLVDLLLSHRERAPTPPHRLNPQLPLEWSNAILRALAKRPEERFPDARAFTAALREGAKEQAPVVTAPPSAAVGAVTPQPLYSRHAAGFRAKVIDLRSQTVLDVTCADLSRGGMFLCTEAPAPPVFSRLKVTVEFPEGAMDCTCEIVRHVTSEQAAAWNMSSGFGVQFIEPSPAFRAVLGRVLAGLPYSRPPTPTPAPEAAEDPEAETLLAWYRKRINGDHYVLLDLLQDVESSDIRSRLREALRALEGLKSRPLSPSQQKKVQALIERVEESGRVLTTPARRALWDANRANFRGVARAISAGLSVTDLEKLRGQFLVERPQAESRAHLHAATAAAWENHARLPEAIEEYERALALDPLNLSLQQRYWALKKRGFQARRQ